MDRFLMGALAMAFWVAGLFFLRFWRKTGDRLFAIFAASFWLLGIIRIALAMTANTEEHQYLYWIRLAAFVLIILAIIDKNRPRKSDQ